LKSKGIAEIKPPIIMTNPKLGQVIMAKRRCGIVVTSLYVLTIPMVIIDKKIK